MDEPTRPGASATGTTEDPKAGATTRPGSSSEKDALVGRLSDRAVDRIPRKRLRTYRIVQAILSPIIRLVFRTSREGWKKVPRREPAILAVNHVSWFDPILVVACLGRPLSALAKSYLFKGWFRHTFFETLGGQIRVDRARRGNEAAVRAAVNAVRAGRCVGIWPEGGRSPTGHLTRGKTGIARIALETGAAVYPVAVLGTHELKPKDADRIKWGTPTKVIVGDPMTFPEFVGKQDDRAINRRVTDQIMLEIARLMGPDEEARYRELLDQDVAPGELPLDARRSA